MLIDSGVAAAHVIALADAGFYPVRLHYPKFHSDGTVGCSCGRADCGSQGKHPVGVNWGKTATRETDVIESMWATEPWNVGIILGLCHGIPEDQAVIDIEDDSPEGRAMADAMLRDYPSPTYSSGKSLHRIFRWSPRLPPVANLTVCGLEFRFGGSGKETQSVAPPSVHKTKARYGWLPGKSPADFPAIPELPQHILDFILEEYGRQHSVLKGPSSGDMSKFKRSKAKITPGGRHNALLQYANSLWRTMYGVHGINGLDDPLVIEQVLTWLLGSNLLTCEPPKPEQEVHTVLDSSISYMRKELQDEIDAKALLETPEKQAATVTEENMSRNFGHFLHTHGIRLKMDPSIAPSISSRDRIDEWTCDWQMRYLSRAEEDLTEVSVPAVGTPVTMRASEFLRAESFARRMQIETQGRIVLNQSFAQWDWQRIWDGAPNDKTKKNGITRGLREFLSSKAEVAEMKEQGLMEQIEDIVFQMSGSLEPLLNGLEQWDSVTGKPFIGRMKLDPRGSGQLIDLRLPEDPETGWYSTRDGIALCVRTAEVTRRYRATFGSGVENRRFAETLKELGFSQHRVQARSKDSDLPEGRWFIKTHGKKQHVEEN